MKPSAAGPIDEAGRQAVGQRAWLRPSGNSAVQRRHFSQAP
jgi:hypothetical protein